MQLQTCHMFDERMYVDIGLILIYDQSKIDTPTRNTQNSINSIFCLKVQKVIQSIGTSIVNYVYDPGDIRRRSAVVEMGQMGVAVAERIDLCR